MSTRVESADKTLRVEVGPAGVIVTVDDGAHEWHWIVSGVDSSLHLDGGVGTVEHNRFARRPEDCQCCAKRLLESVGAGVNQRGPAPRNKNVSGAADCGEPARHQPEAGGSGAQGDRAGSSPAPIGSNSKR